MKQKDIPEVIKKIPNTYKALEEKGWNLISEVRQNRNREDSKLISDKTVLYLKKAKKYDLNKIIEELAEFLHYYFTFQCNNSTRGRYYRDLRKKYSHLSGIERNCAELFIEVSGKINSTRQPSVKSYKELCRICDDVERYLKYNSAPINNYIYSLIIAKFQLNKDWDNVLRICSDAIRFFASKKINKTARYYVYMSTAYLVRGEYCNSKRSISRAIGLTYKNKDNYVKYIYQEIVIFIHSGEYYSAYKSYKTVKPSFINDDQMKEQWQILRGYLYFLHKNGLIPEIKSFRLAKFMNSSPIFTRDKAGNNITIRILAMIHNEKGKVIDKKEAINMYVKKYLKHSCLQRANLFIKFMVHYSRYGFSAQGIKTRVMPILDQIKQIPIYSQNVDIEIIPFDKLAEIILKPKK